MLRGDVEQRVQLANTTSALAEELSTTVAVLVNVTEETLSSARALQVRFGV